MSTLTIAKLLAEGIAALEEFEHPHLDARFLLEGVIGATAEEIVGDGSRPLEASRYRTFIARRKSGEPVAYILGEWEFWSLTFIVTPAVLIPRPSTELLVEWGVDILRQKKAPRAVDVGTGCGAIAIALAKEIPQLEVIAVDRSAPALAVAAANVRHHHLEKRVTLVRSDLLGGISGPFDLVVSNPPYVARGDPALEVAVEEHEPAISLFDDLDGDGLGYFRRLVPQARPLLAPEGTLLLEVGETQGQEVLEIVAEEGFQGRLRPDLAGVDRAVAATLNGDGSS